MRPGLQKGLWSAQEDALLLELVREHGTNWPKITANWRGTGISPGTSIRTSKQIRERWTNKLDPSISSRPWSADEDKKLIETHKAEGNSWAAIAKLLPGRVPDGVKTRYKTLHRRQQKALKASAKKQKMINATGMHILSANPLCSPCHCCSTRSSHRKSCESCDVKNFSVLSGCTDGISKVLGGDILGGDILGDDIGSSGSSSSYNSSFQSPSMGEYGIDPFSFEQVIVKTDEREKEAGDVASGYLPDAFSDETLDDDTPGQLNGLYHDRWGVYRMTKISPTKVRIAEQNAVPMWKPAEGKLHGNVLTVRFSNVKYGEIRGTIGEGMQKVTWSNGAVWTKGVKAATPAQNDPTRKADVPVEPGRDCSSFESPLSIMKRTRYWLMHGGPDGSFNYMQITRATAGLQNNRKRCLAGVPKQQEVALLPL
jgi:hypothetical protein